MSSQEIIYSPIASTLQMCVFERRLKAMREAIRSEDHNLDNHFFSMSFAKKGLVHGLTALHVAVAIKSNRSVDFLLKSGADVNAFTGYGFGRDSSLETEFHPHSKYSIMFTPLHMAVISDCEDICRLLIAHKADVNAEDHKGKTPLEYSMANYNVAKLLIRSGADYQREALIFRAMKKKNWDLVRLLAHLQVKSVYYEDQSPVEFAMSECPEAVPLLISAGKQLHFPNARTKDYLIHIAVRRRNIQWIRLLCQKGCDPNARDAIHNRALHIAVLNECSTEIALVLLSFGADPNLMNLWRVSALAMAVEKGNEEMTKLFLRMKAQVSRNMFELKRAFLFKKFNTAALILDQYSSVEPTILFNNHPILWFFVRQCVGVLDANHNNLSQVMAKLVAMSPTSEVNRIDNVWGTLMHFIIYADVCSPSNCYRPLFTALIQSLKCDINQQFHPVDTYKDGVLIFVERIMANGSALSFALEMNDCHFYAEELIRLGADHSTIKWDQIYFQPNKVKAFKLLVCVGASFPDNFRQYADPTLDPSMGDLDVDLISKEFDGFINWWELRQRRPLSLKDSSRHVIRKAIGSLGCRRLDSEGSLLLGNAFHPYPDSLVKYILFRSDDI